MFTGKANLSQHILIHSNEFAHKCVVCDKKFKRKGHLQRHMAIHKNDRYVQNPLPPKILIFSNITDAKNKQTFHLSVEQILSNYFKKNMPLQKRKLSVLSNMSCTRGKSLQHSAYELYIGLFSDLSKTCLF